MKKILTLLFGVTVLASSNIKAQVVEKGSFIIDAYYGLLSISNNTFKELSGNSAGKFTGIGPVGMRFEYMVSDKIGIGLDGNLLSQNLTWIGNDTTAGNRLNFEYKLFRQVTRIMPRINIHFGGSDDFDGYFGIAAGHRNVTRGYTSNDPTYKGESSSITLIPVAMRLAVGGRYFLTPNFALNGEIGIGGGTILHTGLTFKI
jgi:hypothetical protein